MKKRRLISILLLCAMLAAASCGGEAPASDTTAAPSGETTTQSPETDPYGWTDVDLGGKEVHILNVPLSQWNMHNTIDLDAQTGEALDDAIYKRNRDLEDLYNFKLVVTNNSGYHSGTTINSVILKDVTSGDGQYDAAYAHGASVGALITDGALMNLLEVDSLRLDEPWWNQTTVAQATIGNKICSFAHSYLALNAFDLTVCMFFNENMMEDLKLDKPYQLVRDGKWTLDAFRTYTKAGANLNGDNSFDWNANGNSVYGYVCQRSMALGSIIGAGAKFCSNDDKGMPVLSVENERFSTIVDKLAAMFADKGEFHLGTTNAVSDPSNHMTIFRSRRALFYGGELKTSGEYRDLNDTFGIIPMPKLDEVQDSYYAWTNSAAPVLVMPMTSTDPENTGLVLDALSYLSYRDVLPIYYDVTVSQKGLRNEESIEMLDIIRDSITFDASLGYGWTTAMAESIRDMVLDGRTDSASIIASLKTFTKEQIDKMVSSVIS